MLSWLVSREVRRLTGRCRELTRQRNTLNNQLLEERKAHQRTHDTLQAQIGRYRDMAVEAEVRAETAEIEALKLAALAAELREVDGQ